MVVPSICIMNASGSIAEVRRPAQLLRRISRLHPKAIYLTELGNDELRIPKYTLRLCFRARTSYFVRRLSVWCFALSTASQRTACCRYRFVLSLMPRTSNSER